MSVGINPYNHYCLTGMLFRRTVEPFCHLAISCFQQARFCVRTTAISIPSPLQTSVPPHPPPPPPLIHSDPLICCYLQNVNRLLLHVNSGSSELRCPDFSMSVRFIASVALCMCLLFHTSLGWTFMELALTVCKNGTPRAGTETASNNRFLCCFKEN